MIEAMKGKLTVELMLTEQQVHKWFCHRRQKDKKSKINDTNSGGKQYRGIGLRKDDSRILKCLSLPSLKRVENQMNLNIRNPRNPRSAALGLELNDGMPIQETTILLRTFLQELVHHRKDRHCRMGVLEKCNQPNQITVTKWESF